APLPICDCLVDIWDRLLLYAAGAAVRRHHVHAEKGDARGLWPGPSVAKYLLPRRDGRGGWAVRFKLADSPGDIDSDNVYPFSMKRLGLEISDWKVSSQILMSNLKHRPSKDAGASYDDNSRKKAANRPFRPGDRATLA